MFGTKRGSRGRPPPWGARGLLVPLPFSAAEGGKKRLARAVDRTRVLLQLSDEDIGRIGQEQGMVVRWIERYATRSLVAERTVAAFFLAVGILVLACFAIAVDRFFADTLTWLPVSLTIIGMGMILVGAYGMVQESRLAALQIREEIGAMQREKMEGR